MRTKERQNPMRTIRSFTWLSILALPISSFASLFQVVQLSEPAGFLSQTDAIQQGTNHPSVTPSLSSNGYAFGYWTIDDVRVTGPDGRSLTQVSSVIQAASTYKAHYFQESTDSDSDGIMDWFEYRMFGDLSRGPGDDPDGDEFTNQREDQLGQDPLVKDLIRDGGLSSRASSAFVYADTSMVKATIKSDPAGFVTQTENFLALNSNVSTASLNGETNEYHFAYWSVNGVRQAAPNGTASSQVDLNVSVTSEIIAHYLPSNEDSDSDGVPDWFELHQFGNLTLGPGDDPDGDGFPNKLEGELGQEARIKDLVRDGGLSSRTSTAFVYADTSMVQATIKSNPAGFVTETENYLALNANVSTASLNGQTNGYHFAYWSVNGVRQTAPNGTASSQVDLNVSVTSEIVAHYLPSNEDSDSDGVMDWFELHQFGNLSLGPNDDPDGDGFSNKREGELGQEARVQDLVRDGGLSSRISPSILYFLQINNSPDGLDLNDTIVHANKPAGQTIGTFTPHDDDDPNAIGAYDLSLVDGNGSTDNAKFAITGRNLKTNALLALGTYSIRVRVADDENASFQKTFAIQAVPDPNKDDDNDTLTYAQEQALGTSDDNPDSDGDGFSDGAEVLAGTNPANANSRPNQAPTAIDLNGTSVAENQVAGTIVGEFNATDPDANATITLTFTDGNGSQHNNLFALDANGTLRTTETFDYETNATALHIRVKATDEHNASLAKAFVINVTNVVEDLDGDGIEDHVDPDDDGDGFSDVAEIAYGSDPRNNQSVANQPPSAIDLNGTSVAENQVAGTIVGEFNATDPDANATITLAFTDGNGSQHNTLFTLDANGTLRTAATFDYETNATALHIRIKATDEHNASLAKAFVINVTNVVEDLDGDGIEDHADPDDDGDGFSDAEEIAYGSDPRNAASVANQAPTTIDLNGTSVAENSNVGSVVGILNATDPDANATITLTFADGNGSQHNNLFTLDANGTLRTAATFDYETNATALHIRLKATDEHNASLEKAFVINVTNVVEDLDGDGIEDHFDPDDDGDGFSDAEEIAYGSDPRNAASVANQAPTAIDLNGTFVAENSNAGSIVGNLNATDPDANATITLTFADGNGAQHNNLFTLDANGTLRTAATFDYETNATALHIRVKATDEHNASLAKAFVINVTNVVEDLDGDGIEDHADPDDDGDGFSDAVEIAYGSDPRNAASVANQAPTQLDLNGSSVAENSNVGSVVGNLNATDPDANATITLTFTDGNGSQYNNLFALDANGTLRTTATFDYETNATALHIRVKATDEHNASLAKAFVINVTNIVEDLDGDGIEDHFDPDDDGDGFSDAEEIAYGSDPRNNQSVANHAPTQLDLNGTSIAENSNVGSIVGILNATDTDANATITLTFADGNGSQHNNLFSINANGTLSTAATFDYETNATALHIRVKATDEHNASLAKAFVINVTNVVEDLDGDGIEDHADPDDDGDGFSDAVEIAYGSDPRNNQSVANQAPTQLDLNGTSIAENSNVGSVVGILNATDPDANATITLAFADGNGSQHNNLFSIDVNGSLRTTSTYDYETNATALHIRVRATDEHNASLAKAFVINLTNVVEDLDGDGIEDHADPDDDGDGFSDATEIAYGSDPRNAASVVNRAPTDITLNHSRIAEGRPAGDLVGKIQANDPDDENGTGDYLYALVAGYGPNALFSLDANGTLRTTAILNHEANASQSIRVRATDEWNASLEKNFSIEVIDLPEQGTLPATPPVITLPSWLAGSQPAGSHAPGWYQSSWFGGFHITKAPWLYHSQLGWLYALDDGTGNVWLWTEPHGWLWTGQGLFRHLYRHHDQIWIYFLKNQNGIPRFYNHATQQVE